jgi:hypothetical protein
MIASVTAKIQTKHLKSTNQKVTTVPSYSPQETGYAHSQHYKNLESHVTIFNLLSFQKMRKHSYVTTMLCVCLWVLPTTMSEPVNKFSQNFVLILQQYKKPPRPYFSISCMENGQTCHSSDTQGSEMIYTEPILLTFIRRGCYYVAAL